MSAQPIRLLLDSSSKSFVERIQSLPEAQNFELLTYLGEGQSGFDRLIGEADAVYVYKDDLSRQAIEGAGRLRFIQKHGLHCKNIDIPAATSRGIPVAALPLFRNAAVAEHAMALMLACAHQIIPAHRAVESAMYKELGLVPVRTAQREYRANWAKISGIRELMGSSVGIVGLGDVGLEVARRCQSFGMEVFYFQRSPHPEDVEQEYQARYLPLKDLLATVDFLVLTLPHTPESDKLIAAGELALMKPSAILINVARGAVVDESALVDALTQGTIAMAGLDVYREEPLPETSPLRALPNVVLTPHIGGGSYRSREVDHPAGLRNILRFFRNEDPQGVLNAQREPRADLRVRS